MCAWLSQVKNMADDVQERLLWFAVLIIMFCSTSAEQQTWLKMTYTADRHALYLSLLLHFLTLYRYDMYPVLLLGPSTFNQWKSYWNWLSSFCAKLKQTQNILQIYICRYYSKNCFYTGNEQDLCFYWNTNNYVWNKIWWTLCQ